MKYKNELLVTAAVVAILLLFAGLKACKHHATIAEDKAVQADLKIKADTTTHFTDKAGNQHAEKQQVIGTASQVSTIYNPEIQSLKKQLDIAQKQIQAFTGFNIITPRLQTISQRTDTVYKGDTIFIIKEIHDTITGGTKDSVGLVEYNKHVGWFSRSPYLDVVSYSKGVVITDIQGFRVISGTTSWLSIGPTGALIYTGNNQFIPAVGVGVVMRVWKIPVILSLLKQLK